MGQSVELGRSETPPIARIRCSVAMSPSLESDARRAFPVEHVDGIHEPDGLRLVGHHHRVGAGAATEESNALEQVAGRDTRRGEDQVLAGSEVLGAVDPRFVTVAHPLAAPALLVGAVPEAGLDLAAEAA